MSRKRSYTLIVPCLLFSFLFVSIELGEALKCYECVPGTSDCTKNLGELKECPNIPTTEMTTEGTTKETTKGTTGGTTGGTTKGTTKGTTGGTTGETTGETTKGTTKGTTKETTEGTTKGTTKETTEGTTKGTTKGTTGASMAKNPVLNLGKSDFISNDLLEELPTSTDQTYECFELRVTVQNDTVSKQVVGRGCMMKNSFGCQDMRIKDMQITNCALKTCKSDSCNSSSMKKMGIVSLLFPLITVLLRIR